MKQKLINIKDDHYVLVDESSPIPGRDIVYSYVTNTIVTFTDPRHFSDGTYKKITHSTDPLKTITTEDGIHLPDWNEIKPLSPRTVKENVGWLDEKEWEVEFTDGILKLK